MPGLTHVSVFFQGEAGPCSPMELYGSKAGALAFQREVESWLGPVGTPSKNGSLVPTQEVEGLLWSIFDKPGAVVLSSICAVGSWLL